MLTTSGDDLKQSIVPGAKLKIAAACFSIYAFEALKGELEAIDSLRLPLVFGSVLNGVLFRLIVANCSPPRENRHSQHGGRIRNDGMKSSKTDKIEGAVHQVKGKVKEVTGKIIGNPRLQNEGTAEKVRGKVQRKVGDVKDVFGK